jgi:hypothetical protein
MLHGEFNRLAVDVVSCARIRRVPDRGNEHAAIDEVLRSNPSLAVAEDSGRSLSGKLRRAAVFVTERHNRERGEK